MPSYWIYWTVKGLLNSQYGHIDKEITVFGETKTVAAFLKHCFGFDHDHLAITAIVLAIYPIAFASLFASFIGRLNFQRR